MRTSLVLQQTEDVENIRFRGRSTSSENDILLNLCVSSKTVMMEVSKQKQKRLILNFIGNYKTCV